MKENCRSVQPTVGQYSQQMTSTYSTSKKFSFYTITVNTLKKNSSRKFELQLILEFSRKNSCKNPLPVGHPYVTGNRPIPPCSQETIPSSSLRPRQVTNSSLRSLTRNPFLQDTISSVFSCTCCLRGNMSWILGNCAQINFAQGSKLGLQNWRGKGGVY
jgi:hypothetical protein